MNIFFRLLAATLVTLLVGCGGAEKTSDAEDAFLKQQEVVADQGAEVNAMAMSSQDAAPIDSQVSVREGISSSSGLSKVNDSFTKLQTDGISRKGDSSKARFHPSRVIVTLKTEKIGFTSTFEKNSVSVKNKVNISGFEFSSISGGLSSNKNSFNKLQASEESTQTFVATITDGSTVANAITRLKGSSAVIAAEPDFIWKKLTAPNDPLYADQWYLKNNGVPGSQPGLVGFDIGAEIGWTFPRAASNIVAIIDDGVKTDHPDLVNSIFINPGEIAGNNIDDDADGIIDNVLGADMGNMDGNPHPDFFTSSHGTKIAGIIAATPNNGIGIAGISWNSKIMPIKIEDNQGILSTSYMIKALNFVKAKRLAGVNVRIINLSLGTTEYSSIVRDTFKSVTDAGILVVTAAGNDGLNTAHNRNYPGSFGLPGVINVGASNS
jgi:hypothetical protein